MTQRVTSTGRRRNTSRAAWTCFTTQPFCSQAPEPSGTLACNSLSTTVDRQSLGLQVSCGRRTDGKHLRKRERRSADGRERQVVLLGIGRVVPSVTAEGIRAKRALLGRLAPLQEVGNH